MGDDFAERLARETRAWVEDGLVSEDQARRIRERYEPGAGGVPDEAGEEAEAPGAEAALYGTAAVLAGAAAIAFVYVGLDPPDPGGYLVGSGLALAGLGAALLVADEGTDRVGDVVLAAGLVPLTAAALPLTDPGWGLRLPGLAVAAGAVAWRHERSWVRILGVAGFSLSALGAAMEQFQTTEAGAWFFVAVQSAVLAALLAADRRVWRRDHPTTVALAVVAFAGAAGVFLDSVVDVGGSVPLELALGFVMLLLVSAGLLLAHRGLVAGAGLVLAGDAIVFAFDVGGTFGGSLLLLGLAALLVWQAEAIRRAVG